MNEWKLRTTLEGKGESLTDKAIASRLTRARRVERILCEDLDRVVGNDDKMYDALLLLKGCSAERNGMLQNSLRWYYKSVNCRDFPKLSEYKPGSRIKENSPHQVRTDATRKPSIPPATPERVSNESIIELWKEYCDVKNRIASALGRTNNIVGELAERIVAEYHDGKLLEASHPSADVLLHDGTLIQVKARMLTGPGTTSLSAIRSWNFDLLAVILLSPEGRIVFGGEIPCENAQRHAREVRHVNGWTITTSDAFLSDPSFRILTEDYADVLRRI